MTDWRLILQSVRTIQTELMRVAPFRDAGLVPNPRAKPWEIDIAEAKLTAPLPPSYRAFLELHNGWPRFFEGADLLGTADLTKSAHRELIRAAVEATEGPSSFRDSAEHSRAQAIVFGADPQGTTLFAFDPDDVDADGEYAVIAWVNEIGVRQPNFAAFLAFIEDVCKSELASHGKVPLRMVG